MKKKLLSLLTLLLAVCSGAWADDTVLFTTDFTESGWSSLNSTSTSQNITIGGTTVTVKANKTSNLLSVNTSTGTLTWGERNFSNKDCYLAIPVSGVNGKLTITVANGSDNTRFTYAVVESISSNPSSTDNSSSANPSIVTVNSLSKTDYYVCIGRQGGSFTQATSITITTPAPAVPIITVNPVSTSYVTGASAKALSVTATGTGTLYYEWFSNSSTSTDGAVSVQAKAADASTYTPSTSSAGTTYYYCAVTDDNGTTNSDFAAIRVSAAAAPSAITVTGLSSTARGADAITLNAEVTGGVPTPTIEWFKCDDALGTNPVSQGEATTDNTTFNVGTTNVGTYYYYAQAANATGNVSSAVKTITIVPKAPTMTAGGVFVTDSKNITISKADGEDGSAVIMYSVDNGESWTDFTSLNIIGTTTVKAKVVQAGLESDVATATYTKVVLVDQTTVTGVETWDWSQIGSGSVQLTDATTPTKSEEFVLKNIELLHDYTIAGAFGDAQKLKVVAQYPFRNDKNGKMLQGNSVKFTTTVPGIVDVDFSNTGDKRPYRYLRVNGVQTSYKSDNVTKVSATGIAVPAGEVVIDFYIPNASDPQSGNNDVIGVTMCRVMKIVFTPTATITTNAGSWASFTPSWNATLSAGATAYIITNVAGDAITAKAVDVLKAGEGYFVKGAAASTPYTATASAETATSVDGNMIKGCTTDTNINGEGDDKYVLGTDGSGKSGLFLVNSAVTVGAGKAYLQTATAGARKFLSLDFDDVPTGITNVEASKGLFDGDVYNLRGQRVAQPQRGLYILNGKKVVIK